MIAEHKPNCRKLTNIVNLYSKNVCASFMRGDIGFCARFQEARAVVKKQKTHNVIFWAKTLCALAVIFLVCSQGYAQVSSAELSGNVLDSSGAAIAGATVQAIN